MALYLDVHPDDVLYIADAEITVVRKSNAKVRLRILKGTNVKLVRRPKQAELPLDGGDDGRSK